MKVLLDGSEIENAGTTLSSALDAAMRAAGDRMIIEAKADGQPVSGAHLESPPDDDPYAQELVLTSADPITMVSVMLHEAADLLETVRTQQRSAGEQFQRGELERGVEEVGNVLEGWGAVGRAVELAEASGVLTRVEDSTSDHESVHALAASLATPLRELKDAMSNQDWAEVSDALSYDLDEHARHWQCWLSEAAKAIRR